PPAPPAAPGALLRAVLAVAVGLHQPVPLEPLQRGVDLADIQRPDLTGPRLELFPQLKPVFGPLAEQREQRMPDAHTIPLSSSILGIVLDRPRHGTPVNPPICPPARPPSGSGRGVTRCARPQPPRRHLVRGPAPWAACAVVKGVSAVLTVA